VDNPTQNLESYFLDIVAKAREAAHETSGAQSGARVAAYLRGGIEEAPAPDKLLEKLALPQAQPKTESKIPAEPAKVKLDESKLAALSQPVPAAPAQKTEPAPEVKPEDLARADEKLSSLLGGQK